MTVSDDGVGGADPVTGIRPPRARRPRGRTRRDARGRRARRGEGTSIRAEIPLHRRQPRTYTRSREQPCPPARSRSSSRTSRARRRSSRTRGSTTPRSWAFSARFSATPSPRTAGTRSDAVGDEYVAAFAEHGRLSTRRFDGAARDARRRVAGATQPSAFASASTRAPRPRRRGLHGRRRRARFAHRERRTRRADRLLGGDAADVDGVPHRDLGEHRLEGLPRPERIYQLLADDLPRDFPPLRNTISTLGSSDHGGPRGRHGAAARGVARLLADAGFDVVAQSGNAEDLLRHVAMHKPSVAIVDIRMPPTHTDEGLRAAGEIRRALHSGTGCSCSRSTSRPRTRWISSRRRPKGSATCSRTAWRTSRSSRRRCGASPREDPRSTPPSSAELVGRRRQDDPLDAADAARARGARAHGRGPLQSGDRGPALRDARARSRST